MNEPNPLDNPLEGDEHDMADAAETTFAPADFWQQLEHWRWQQQRKARTRQARNNMLTDVLRLLDFNGIDGDYIEFGCFRAEPFHWSIASTANCRCSDTSRLSTVFRGFQSPNLS